MNNRKWSRIIAMLLAVMLVFCDSNVIYAVESMTEAQTEDPAAAQAAADAEAARQAAEAQAAADQAAADQAYAEQVAADAQAALNEAYNTGDEETIANAEYYAQQTADQAQQSADQAQAAQDQAQAAQDEATAADQTVYDTVADAGIDTSEVTGTTDDSSSSLRQQIVDYALQFVGNPYVYGGTSLTNGADCSGFAQHVYAQFGIGLPRTSAAQSQYGMKIPVSEAAPGDLIFYAKNGQVYHVVIYIGNGRTVEAASTRSGICSHGVNYANAVWATRLLS